MNDMNNINEILTNINSHSPDEVLNIFALIFENSLSDNDIKSLESGIESSSNVDLTRFNDEQKSTFHYFLANGWSYILQLRYPNSYAAPLNGSKEFENEIYNLRCAWQLTKEKKDVRACEILTNMGCAFDHIGRFSEAQDYFNQALAINPNFGMAIGNKGFGLYRYAREVFDGVHQFIFMQYAREYLLEACDKADVYNEARRGFKKYAEHIATVYPKKELNDFKQYGNFFQKLSLDEVRYRKWCIDNILFLNPLNDVLSQTVVAQDILHTPTMTLKNGEKPIYQSIYNQMKQEFVSARFLFYEGVTANEPHFSDKDVRLYFAFDTPIYALSIEKVKISFRMCFSIFDKIAYLINIYLNLGISNHRVSFRSIWHINGDRKRPINEQLFSSQNIALQGLFWLSKDLDEGVDSPIEPEAKEIATMRNFMEHKSFKVVEMKNPCWDEFPETYEIERKDFYAKAFKILKLTRSALIYLSSFIYEEESIRKRDGLTVPIEMPIINDADKM
jgi:tetratricopeptide (TPR) repeat protein